MVPTRGRSAQFPPGSGAAVLAVLIHRGDHPPAVRRGGPALAGLVGVWIGLGVSVIWLHVPLVLALLHQWTAVLLFLVVFFLIHRLRAT